MKYDSCKALQSGKTPGMRLPSTESFLESAIVLCLLVAGLATEVRSASLPFEESPFGYHGAYAQARYARYSPAQLEVFNRGLGAKDIDDYTAYIVDHLKDMGCKWERPAPYADWFLVQPQWEDVEQGVFHWEALDRLYGYARSRGINTLANFTIRKTAEYTIDTRDRTPENSFEPYDKEAYQKFVRAIVERYDGDGRDDAPNGVIIKHWQVDNEPNGENTGTPESYAEMVRLTYEAAKQANPECKIMLAGPVGILGGTEKFHEYFDPVLEKLNGKYFDIFDLHYYGLANGDYRRIDPRLEDVRSTLAKYGYSDVTMWCTETATASDRWLSNDGNSTFHQTQRRQAVDLVKRYVHLLSLDIEKIFWCLGLTEGFVFPDDDLFFDHVGLVYDGVGMDDRGSGVKKLGYYTYKRMTEILEGSDWKSVRELETGVPNVYAYRVPKPKEHKTIVVAWWDYFDEAGGKPEKPEGEKEVILPVEATEVQVSKAVPDAEFGDDVIDYRATFPVTTLRAEDNTIHLKLDDSPVYIEYAPPKVSQGK